MDLPAYLNSQDGLIDKYTKKHYGDIPRPRGVRFMKVEEKMNPISLRDRRLKMLIQNLISPDDTNVVGQWPSPMLIDAINQYYGLALSYRENRENFLEQISNDYRHDILADVRKYNSYVGQDVIYIHTRCGDCGRGYFDSTSNYIYDGAAEWEEKHKDLFLEHITEFFDCTYCTHYFKAVIDDDYKKIIKLSIKDEEMGNAKTQK